LTHIDAALNLAWALLCVTALVWHAWRERHFPATRAVRIRRTLSVFVAVVALFPVISASDDRVRLEDLNSQFTRHAAFDRSHPENLSLSLQLEDLEHAQLPLPFVLILSLCFLLLIGLEQSERRLFRHRDSLSRGPPQTA
jgi:hypothetical protein